jgi:hypothetical protein
MFYGVFCAFYLLNSSQLNALHTPTNRGILGGIVTLKMGDTPIFSSQNDLARLFVDNRA